MYLFFFKQKTAYEVRISDWSSDVCSSDLETMMNRKFALAALACTALSSPAVAQDVAPAATAESEDAIVVTAARTILPPSALPLTIDIIDKDALDQPLAISGSVTDAVSTLTPSFSPTRPQLSGSGEKLRGRAPLHAIKIGRAEWREREVKYG